MLARRVQVDASTAAAAFSSTAAKKPPPSSACCPTLSAQPSRFELDTTDLFTDVVAVDCISLEWGWMQP